MIKTPARFLCLFFRHSDRAAGFSVKPGREATEEIAERLGRHRCRIVDLPAGIKDANDLLLANKPQAEVRADPGTVVTVEVPFHQEAA